jgi:hypothetical protein
VRGTGQISLYEARRPGYGGRVADRYRNGARCGARIAAANTKGEQMKIQEQDIYHGPALMQIVEAPSFKALNKTDDGIYGHYAVNKNHRLFVKYATARVSPWKFQFDVKAKKAISADVDSGAKTFVCLS